MYIPKHQFIKLSKRSAVPAVSAIIVVVFIILLLLLLKCWRDHQRQVTPPIYPRAEPNVGHQQNTTYNTPVEDPRLDIDTVRVNADMPLEDRRLANELALANANQFQYRIPTEPLPAYKP